MWLPAEVVYEENLRPKSVARKQRVDETKEFIDCEPCVPSAGALVECVYTSWEEKGQRREWERVKNSLREVEKSIFLCNFPSSPLLVLRVWVCASLEQKKSFVLCCFSSFSFTLLFSSLFSAFWCRTAFCLLLFCLSFGHTQVCHTSACLCRKNYFTLKAFSESRLGMTMGIFPIFPRLFFLSSLFSFSALRFKFAWARPKVNENSGFSSLLLAPSVVAVPCTRKQFLQNWQRPDRQFTIERWFRAVGTHKLGWTEGSMNFHNSFTQILSLIRIHRLRRHDGQPGREWKMSNATRATEEEKIPVSEPMKVNLINESSGFLFYSRL